jgi:(p)ppGpp synthase/HD superfamily hydrolase
MHCLEVMRLANSNDEELNCIALGHDLIEDTDVTIEFLLENFTVRIALGISGLTKEPNSTYEEYLNGVAMNSDTILVKLCDLRHNSDIRRLKGLTEKDFERMKKYQNAYHFLKSKYHPLDKEP